MIEDVDRKFNSFFLGGVLACIGFLFLLNNFFLRALGFILLWICFGLLLNVGIKVSVKKVNKVRKKSWKKVNG